MAGSAAARYAALEPTRMDYVNRGRECAKLTLPFLFPEEGANGSTTFISPEQSLSARGVNNLAAKLVLALMPPNAPFMKMEVDDMTAAEITGVEGAKDAVDEAFNRFTRRIMTDVEARALRTDAYETFQHLLVNGNALLYVPDDGFCRVYRLDKYVVKRDPSGNLLELVLKEKVAYAALSEEIKAQVPQTPPQESPGGDPNKVNDTALDLYTHVYILPSGRYYVCQELDGVKLDGAGEVSKEDLPYLPLRFTRVSGEDYGRSYVEQYLGDIRHLESQSLAIREYVAIATRIILMVAANSTTNPEDIAKAENGAVIKGRAEDITFLQMERYNDFRVAVETVDRLERRLTFVFLLNTAIQRPGERVTAEEIRYMARELEDTLGGVYSLLAVEFQLPLARLLIAALQRRKALPELPKGVANPKIVTGMDALGRGNDLSNLLQLVEIIAKDPEGAAVLNRQGLYQRIANALNIETKGIILSPEEVQAAQQQRMMTMMAERLGPNAINQLGGIAQKTMETQQPNV